MKNNNYILLLLLFLFLGLKKKKSPISFDEDGSFDFPDENGDYDQDPFPVYEDDDFVTTTTTTKKIDEEFYERENDLMYSDSKIDPKTKPTFADLVVKPIKTPVKIIKVKQPTKQQPVRLSPIKTAGNLTNKKEVFVPLEKPSDFDVIKIIR